MQTLNINTQEGWNTVARENNSRALLERGIIPSEENYQAFIQGVRQDFNKMEKKHIPIVAIMRSVE